MAIQGLEARRIEAADHYDLESLIETLSLAEELRPAAPAGHPPLRNFFRKIRRQIERVGGFTSEERRRFATELEAQRAEANGRLARGS